ncbi:MAG: MBL fold metallo-hydrolase [Gaiellaceae bacterium MAG52_C11]|nr:MBL fold metallo-hydrolase [Candidatus Gaiellasilicea maunaloa]
MRLDIIGSSPAWPNPGGACSGYLVEGRLLLDCGPGVLAKLRERPGTDGWPDVEAIAITHLHLDHWGDLVPWVWGSLFGPGAEHPKPELRLPPGARAALLPILAQLGGEDMLERAFEVDEYESGRPFELAGLTLTALPVVHYTIPAFGFRVVGERTLAYSGDTGPCNELLELAQGADLFLCEATLDDPDSDGPRRGHLSADEARAAGGGSGTRRLVLTHRPDERTAPPGIELAHDGLELSF